MIKYDVVTTRCNVDVGSGGVDGRLMDDCNGRRRI